MTEDRRGSRHAGHTAKERPLPTTFHVLRAAATGFALIFAYGLARGDPARTFADGHPGTYLSMALLLATAYVCFGIRRRRLSTGGRRAAILIWLLIGVGFVFLAIDVVFEIHEKLDRLIHSVGGFEETAANDRTVILWMGVPEGSAEQVKNALGMVEDAAKIAAEAVLLAGFLHALRVLRTRPSVS